MKSLRSLASSQWFLFAALFMVAGSPSALAQRASLSNTTRSFGSVGIGSTSAAKSVTLSNSASVALSVSSIAVTGDYAQTNTCGSSVAARGSCTINITFTPTVAGSRPGTVTITDNATNSPQTITLTGTGVAPASLSPATRSYASTKVGSTTASKSFTLTNNQSGALAVSISTTGDFVQTNNCGSQLAGGDDCTIQVSFKPTANGARTGTVVATVGSGIVLTGTLSGTGTGATVPVTVTPASLTFAAQSTSTTSASQSVTIQNAQATTLTITGMSFAGDFGKSATTCGATLNAGTSCTVSIAFTPTATGARTGSFIVTHNAANSPQSVTLSGQGTAALQTITVTPSNLQFFKGKTQQFTATGTYADNTTKDITSQVTWSSGDSTVVTISSAGLATAVNAGVTTIIATNGSVQGSTPATVATPALSGISISPTSASVAAGTAQQFTATAGFSDGSTQDVTSSASWNSSDSTLATVAAGKATTLKQGAVTIQATLAAKIANASLTVLAAGSCSTTIDMKLLVVSSGQTEADFPAIKQILDYVGTPYTVLDFKTQKTGVTAAMLSDGACHGFFQGVIFANGNYITSLPGMALLTAYEQKFGVRQLNWFATPGAAFGLNPSNKTVSASSTYTGNYASGASSVFFYANTATPIAFSNATVYLASPLATGVTPLISDASGNVLSLIYDQGDGRQYLTQTFDSNQYLMHNLVVAYGLLNWVTKGVFLGEYHIYASAQVDDVFIDDSEWIAGTKCGTDSGADSLPTFRLDAADIDAFIAWQDSKQSNPLLPNFMVSLAFNGVGTNGDRDYTGLPNNAVDDLTPKLKATQSKFNWISHTWDHPDSLNGMNQAQIDGEVVPNNSEAATLGLTNWNPANMVTPGVTGLNDTKVPGYLVKDGIRYVVTDTSVIGQVNNGPNPSPNVGIVNSFATQLYEVPRHANDLYYNVSIPADWQAEYRCIYASQSPYSTYTSTQIRDYISASFVVNMLMGDMDPEMFHQPNMHAYDGTHSLLGDMYDETFTTYFKLLNLPVLSPSLDVIGQKMQNRNAYNLSGVTASIVNGATPQIVVTIPASSAMPSATIPVTGLNSAGAEVYGGQNISHLPLTKGQTVTLPLQ
jgi:Bacterial Ig-like domain (group 2)/Abnormal spindle-like microcephaly-assoc'd, ASPM-SPD-2-Hydin